VKISIQQFLGELHSWSIIGQNIARSLIHQNHTVHLQSTNGLLHFPDDLKPYLVENFDNDYDLELSYTAMKNFPVYLNHSQKSKKFGIWAWEWAGKNSLPDGFAKNYKYCHRILAPSNFVKQTFIDSGVPEEKIIVIPHGVNVDKFETTQPLQIKTNKQTKILLNIAQPHLRKNLPGALEAFGKAFTNKDDVCLILKVVDKEPKLPFDVSFNSIFKTFQQKYKNHAEIKVIKEFIPDIEGLYKSCDILFSLNHCEGFYMPGLEALAFGLVNVCSNYGGQLDFLNNTNSLLVDGSIEKANPKSMYWQSKPSLWFVPDINDAANKLQYAVNNLNDLKQKVKLQQQDVIQKYNWNNITQQILQLSKEV